MTKKFEASLQLDARYIGNNKTFKVLAAMVRSALANEHGFQATKGFKNLRLSQWPIVIRFVTQENRDSFESQLKDLLKNQVLKNMAIRHLKPTNNVTKAFRMAVGQ